MNTSTHSLLSYQSGFGNEFATETMPRMLLPGRLMITTELGVLEVAA